MIEANIEARGEQEWRAWITAARARLGADELTLSLERQLARQAVSGLMGMDPYEADPTAYESAIYAAGLAIRAYWAKGATAQRRNG